MEILQRAFGEEIRGNIDVPHEQHLACILLVDTSGSMIGQPIENLNKAINDFKEQTMMDELARKRVDIAIIEFNSTASVVQDFVPLPEMSPVKLTARGTTAMGAGINMAIDMAKERVRLYAQLGTPCFKPWIFMITDGSPTDDVTAAQQRILEEESKGAHGKLKFWALGIAPNYNKNVLLSLTKRCLAVNEASFTGIFNWLSESMVAISASTVGMDAPLPPIHCTSGEKIICPVVNVPDNWY